jgi:hypothetical protein
MRVLHLYRTTQIGVTMVHRMLEPVGTCSTTFQSGETEAWG